MNNLKSCFQEGFSNNFKTSLIEFGSRLWKILKVICFYEFS